MICTNMPLICLARHGDTLLNRGSRAAQSQLGSQLNSTIRKLKVSHIILLSFHTFLSSSAPSFSFLFLDTIHTPPLPPPLLPPPLSLSSSHRNMADFIKQNAGRFFANNKKGQFPSRPYTRNTDQRRASSQQLPDTHNSPSLFFLPSTTL